jgi:threonine aldolase
MGHMARYVPLPSPFPIRADFYSDTLTRPTPEMRQAMADAEVGDEQKGEDPSVNRLLEEVCELLGKPAAVLLPSGTMANQISLAVHCRPGDEFYCDRTAHPLHSEAGGGSAIAGAQPRAIDGERGVFTAAQLEAALSPDSRYAPRPRLLWVEQTANLAGGTCWTDSQIKEVTEAAARRGLAAHLDGARLLNAAVALRTPAAAIAAPFSSAWIDFSKGLGAPIGAALAGDADFVDEAWRWKQRLGGSMRQAGVVAAAASYALAHHVDRLTEDHRRARRLAEGLAAIEGTVIDPATVDTNIVVFGVPDYRGGAAGFTGRLLEAHGVRASAGSGGRVRMVAHLDIGDQDVNLALAAVADVLAEARANPFP